MKPSRARKAIWLEPYGKAQRRIVQHNHRRARDREAKAQAREDRE